MNTPCYSLTDHALERLEERSSISPEIIDTLMSGAIEMPYALDADRAAKMFWSVPDDRAYLAFYNRITREVVTVFEAYKWIGKTFKGKVYSHRDMLGRIHGNGVTKVRRSDVAHCLRQAGLPPRNEFDPLPPKSPPPGTDALYSHEYVARFDLIDRAPITRHVKSIPFGSVPEDIGIPELLEALRAVITHRNIDLDRVKGVILELREPKRGKNPAGIPIDEIELDQRMLKEVLVMPSSAREESVPS